MLINVTFYTMSWPTLLKVSGSEFEHFRVFKINSAAWVWTRKDFAMDNTRYVVQKHMNLSRLIFIVHKAGRSQLSQLSARKQHLDIWAMILVEQSLGVIGKLSIVSMLFDSTL